MKIGGGIELNKAKLFKNKTAGLISRFNTNLTNHQRD